LSASAVTATALRVLAQLRHDRRTLALVLVVPPALVALLKVVFDGSPGTFDRIGAPLVGVFPLIVMFLVTSIAMLRERTTGTLERLMSMPMAKLDLLLGYGLAFALLAAVQAAVTGAVAFWLLDVQTDGPVLGVVAFAIANALLGMALGLLLSAFAATEFQAVQFMPAVLLPQIVLSGLLEPRPLMPHLLRAVSEALPVTYAYDGLVRVTTDRLGAWVWIDAGVVAGSIVCALALGSATLRRRTA
jgi:ABC-2 type transport system permease protein